MRRSHVLAVAAIALTALSGCGPSDQDRDQDADGGAKVATLTSRAAGPSASAAAQRPRERLDTTPEEFEAMLAPFNKCVKAHGGFVKGEGGPSARPPTKAQMDKLEEANRICEPQYFPLPPWEKDPANPAARDFAREVVKCLKDKGIEHVAVGDDGVSLALGGERNDARSITRGMELLPGCERAVAAEMK